MASKSAISKYLAEIGSKGGSVTGTKKGFASLGEDERKAIAQKAAAGRRAAKAKRKKAAK
jgi:hypothetical protein